MRFATLNTWGMRGDWDSRRDVLRAGFRSMAPDIITLQETVLTSEHDQAREILAPEYHLAQQTDREIGRDGAPAGQGITTASRWPIGRILEVDLHLTDRTAEFACSCLITEILGPPPLGRIWVANHFPDYQLDHERERRLQSAKVGRALEELVGSAPGHVIVAGDLDADFGADSIRFWTGRHVINDLSVCYRSSWEAIGHRPADTQTYLPDNPLQTEAADWPNRSIDHVFVRCDHNGPTLLVNGCMRIFNTRADTVSDHYGVLVDLCVPRAAAGGGTGASS